MFLGLGALWLVAARALAADGTEPLGYEMDPGLTCPTSAQVRAALERDIGDFQIHGKPDGPEGGRLRIVRGPEDTLRVELWKPGDSGPTTTRLIQGGSCASRAEAVALLALSWLAQPSGTDDQAPRPQASPVPGPRPIEPPPMPMLTAREQRKPGWRPMFEPRVGGGIFTPSAPALIGGAIQGSLELHLNERWGVSIHADWLTPLHAKDPASAGSLFLHRFDVGIDATWEGWPLPRVMGLTLGLQDEIDQADPTGYLVENRTVAQTLQLRVAVLYRWFVAGPLFAYAEGSGTVGLWQHRFAAHDPALDVTLLTLPALQVALNAGLGWRFF